MLEVININKSFGKQSVLENINFKLEPGECIALVAPNGSGKTTLMSIIAGITESNEGNVFINQMDCKTNDFYRQIGFMQDNSVLYPYLTGYDHLSFVAMAHDLPKQSVLDTAKRLDIDSFMHKRVSAYSLGMKQQLLFALSIIHKPKVLLLDEPFNGLDPLNLIKIRNWILTLNKEGETTIILSSHNLDEIDRISRKVFFLKDKHILERELNTDSQKHYCISIDTDVYDKNVLNGDWLSDKQIVVSKDYLNEALSSLSKGNYKINDIETINNGSQFLFNEIYNK